MVTGSGKTVKATFPKVTVEPGAGGADIVSAPFSRCALLASGGVDCWGASSDLGRGSTTCGSVCVAGPVSGLGGSQTKVASIANSIGGDSYCADLETGGVDCWGSNGSDQLGNGSTNNSPTPGPVLSAPNSPLVGVTQVTGSSYEDMGGYNSYCALRNGNVWCWGNNAYGQLGNNTAGSISFYAVEVQTGSGAALANVVSLAAGGLSYCALLKSGQVNCWGYNDDGQLGDGTLGGAQQDHAVPVMKAGSDGLTQAGKLSGVAEVKEGGYTNFCALLTSGKMDCWGSAALGDGLSANSSSAVPVVGVNGTHGSVLTKVSTLVSDNTFGGGSWCAITSAGGENNVACWGYPAYGELGNGSDGAGDIFYPVLVDNLGVTGPISDASDIASDDAHSYCLALSTGYVDCWGSNVQGELGHGVFGTPVGGPPCPVGCSAIPIQVDAVSGPGVLANAVSVEGQNNSYCATLSTGEIDCWGEDHNGQLGDGKSGNTAGSAIPVEALSP